MTRFGDSALRLAGLASRLLGWRPDEFWRATPAELAAALWRPEGNGPVGNRILPLSRDEFNLLMEDDHVEQQ